jgi:hypothetical protein
MDKLRGRLFALSERFELRSTYGEAIGPHLKRFDGAYACISLRKDASVRRIGEVMREAEVAGFEFCTWIAYRKEDPRFEYFHQLLRSWHFYIEGTVRHLARQCIRQYRIQHNVPPIDRDPKRRKPWELEIGRMFEPAQIIEVLAKIGKGDAYYEMLAEALQRRPAPDFPNFLDPEWRLAQLAKPQQPTAST